MLTHVHRILQDISDSSNLETNFEQIPHNIQLLEADDAKQKQCDVQCGCIGCK